MTKPNNTPSEKFLQSYHGSAWELVEKLGKKGFSEKQIEDILDSFNGLCMKCLGSELCVSGPDGTCWGCYDSP